MEFVESLVKEGQLVSFGGYLYRKDKTNKTTINWRCAVKACKGRLTTTINAKNGDVPTRVGGEHVHAPDPARIEVKKVQSRVTEKAVNTQEPPRRIIADEIQPLSQEAASRLRSNRNLEVMINRKRKQVRLQFALLFPSLYCSLCSAVYFALLYCAPIFLCFIYSSLLYFRFNVFRSNIFRSRGWHPI